jgi:hypothetical protein
LDLIPCKPIAIRRAVVNNRNRPAAKDRIPIAPAARGDQLGFGSEGAENTSGTRGGRRCGFSGAQATAQKAMSIWQPLIFYLSVHYSLLCLCLPPAPFCPCPLSPPHPPEPLPSSTTQALPE